MKKSVKIILALVVLLAGVGGGLYYINMPVALSLTKVEPKTAQVSFTEIGRAVSERSVKVYPLVQGEIVKINVNEGQSVRKGDVLCEIDSSPYTLQISKVEGIIKGYEAQIANLGLERQRAISDMMTNKNNLVSEIKALDAQEALSHEGVTNKNVSVEEQKRLQSIIVAQRESDLKRAEEDLRKAELLYNAGGISLSEFESAKSLVKKYENDLNISKQELAISAIDTKISEEEYYKAMKESINSQIDAINTSMSKDYSTAMRSYYEALIQSEQAGISQLNANIDNCKITAPEDGVISSLSIKHSNVVSMTTEIAEITSNGQQLVEAYVSTRDLENIKVGDKTELILKRRSGDVSFEGEIVQIATSAEIKLSAVGVEESKVKVSIRADLTKLPENVQFGPGFDVDVKFIIYSEENKLAVPKTALFQENDVDTLWVVKDGKAQKATVTKGLELRSETIIEEGVNPEDLVVTDSDNDKLKNGVKVKPID